MQLMCQINQDIQYILPFFFVLLRLVSFGGTASFAFFLFLHYCHCVYHHLHYYALVHAHAHVHVYDVHHAE